jgi:hypothetical protein
MPWGIPSNLTHRDDFPLLNCWFHLMINKQIDIGDSPMVNITQLGRNGVSEPFTDHNWE